MSAREKFGLSWLNPNAPRAGGIVQTAQGSRSGELANAALVAVGVKVLSKLNAASNKTAAFDELIAQSGVPIGQLIPVVSYLAKLSWVRYVDSNKVQLTEEGAAQVS